MSSSTVKVGKDVLIQQVAEHCSASRKQVGQVLDSLTEIVSRNLEQDRRVMLTGIGQLIPDDKPARLGRNPSSGEMIPIAERKVAKFKVSKTLKDRMNATERK